MALTEFGNAVRKGRNHIGDTLLKMAVSLDVSPSFLSGLETGSKKVSKEWVVRINTYFASRDYKIDNLAELAQVSNNMVDIEGLPLQQKMLVAGFSKSELTSKQLSALAKLLGEIKGEALDE